MALNLLNSENYLLLDLVQLPMPAELDECINVNRKDIEELPYIIVRNSSDDEMNESLIQSFASIRKLTVEKNGLMLFCHFGDSDIKKLEQKDLTHISSFDEAVDYIFMDQLEKELGED